MFVKHLYLFKMMSVFYFPPHKIYMFYLLILEERHVSDQHYPEFSNQHYPEFSNQEEVHREFMQQTSFQIGND